MIATSSGTRLAGRLWFLIFLGAAMLASHVEVRADGNSTSTSASNTSSNSTNTTMAPSTTTTPNTTVAPSNATTPPPSTSNSNATTAAPTNNSSTNAPSATNMTNTTTGAPNSTNTTTNTTSTPSPQNGGTPTAPPDANVGAYSCNGLTLRQDLSFRSATTVTINGCVVASLNFYDTAPGAKITITNTQAVGGGIYFYGGLRGSSSLTVSNSDISDPVATGVQTALLEIWGGVNESSSVTISGNSIHTEQSRFTSAVRFAASDSAVVSITYNNVAWLNSATAALFNVSAVSGAQVTLSYNTLKLGNCQEGTLLMAPWVVKATYTASHNIFAMGKIAFMSGISIGLLRPASTVNIENNTIVSDTSTVIGLGCGICITGGAGADVWSSWTPTSLTIRYNRVTFQATSSTSVGFSLQDVHNAKVQLLSNNITVTSLLNAATGILVSVSPFNSTLVAATKMDAALWNFNANYFSNILVILGVTCIGISIAPTMNAVTSIQNQSITAAGIASSSSSVAVAGIVFTGGVYAGNTNVAGGLQTNLTIGPGSNSISSTMATVNGVADFVAALYCPNGGSMLQQSNLLVQNVAFAQYVPAVKAVVGLSLPGVSSGSATITQNSVTVVNGQPYATTLYAIGCEVSGLSLTSHIAASGTGSNLYFAFNFGRIDTTAVNAPSASYRALQIGVALGAVTSKALANVFNNDLRLFFLEGAVRSGDSTAVLPLEVSSGATFLVSNNLLQGSTPMTSCLCSNSNGGYGQCSGSIIPDCSITGVSFSAITSNAYVSASTNRFTVPNASQTTAYLVKQLTGGSAFVLSSDIISVNALLIPLFNFGTIQASTVYMASLSATYALSTSLFTATVPNAALYISHADAGASINMTSSSITTSSTVLTSATLFNPGISIGSPDSSGAGYVAFGSSSNKLDSFSYLNVPATLPTGATLYAMSTCDSYLKGNSVTSSSISKGVTLLTCSGSGTSTPSERMAILNLNIDPSSFKSAVFASALASTMGLTPSAVIVTSVTALPTGSALGLTQVTVQFQTSASALQAESLTASQKTLLGVTSAIAATDAPTTAPPPPAVGGDNVVALVVGLTVGSVVMLGLGLVVARTMGGNDDKRRKGNDDNEHSQPLNGRKKGGGLNNVLKVETAAAPPPPPPPPPAAINLDDDLL